MKVVFRVDASNQIGTGHIMRCLTLADALKLKGADVQFICRLHEGSLIERIEKQGFRVHALPLNSKVVDRGEVPNNSARERTYGIKWLGSTQQQDAEQCRPILDGIKPDWLIVDHYGVDETWQLLLKDSAKKLMVIDDLADRKHLCDVLLDQTFGRTKKEYVDYVPSACRMLLGSKYALLRPEFAEWRDYSLKRRANPELKKLLISMGGVDADNVTGQVLEGLKSCGLSNELDVTVVLGETSPNIAVVQKQATELPFRALIKTNVSNMAELMSKADLAIGAAGATTWERCCLGVPSIIVMLADNQKYIIDSLSKLNVCLKVDKKDLSQQIKEAVLLPKEVLQALSRDASKIVDGLGVDHVVEATQG
jgi:UDP-2,4-diacetamido-2,4,6-trideoxy-beta-L-altropyranose hydrolase